jgi:hypothetical protein
MVMGPPKPRSLERTADQLHPPSLQLRLALLRSPHVLDADKHEICASTPTLLPLTLKLALHPTLNLQGHFG